MSGIKRTASDSRFSKRIRERDQFTCQKCRTVHAPNSKGLHCHHLFTRRIAATRFDEDNAVALCYPCHTRAHQEQAETRAWWRSVIGAERYDAMESKAHGKRDRVA